MYGAVVVVVVVVVVAIVIVRPKQATFRTPYAGRRGLVSGEREKKENVYSVLRTPYSVRTK